MAQFTKNTIIFTEGSIYTTITSLFFTTGFQAFLLGKSCNLVQASHIITLSVGRSKSAHWQIASASVTLRNRALEDRPYKVPGAEYLLAHGGKSSVRSAGKDLVLRLEVYGRLQGAGRSGDLVLVIPGLEECAEGVRVP